MRARYSAYVEGAIDFIVDSHEPKSRAQVDREFAARWAKESEWKSLEVVEATGGGAKDTEGAVRFVARYAHDGAETDHRETGKFVKVDGRWYYADGEVDRPQPVVRQGPKIGRNDPCPCGSGKKYKKCHGASA